MHAYLVEEAEGAAQRRVRVSVDRPHRLAKLLKRHDACRMHTGGWMQTRARASPLSKLQPAVCDG